jgi:hypothetical protein
VETNVNLYQFHGQSRFINDYLIAGQLSISVEGNITTGNIFRERNGIEKV